MPLFNLLTMQYWGIIQSKSYSFLNYFSVSSKTRKWVYTFYQFKFSQKNDKIQSITLQDLLWGKIVQAGSWLRWSHLK